MLELGSTFLPHSDAVDAHLWIVISDPLKNPEAVIVVSLTTWKPFRDDSCILEVGDHPFIRHKSCIAYIRAKLTTAHDLQQASDRGLLEMREPIARPVLWLILIGARQSPTLDAKLRRVLVEQEPSIDPQ